MADFIQTTNTKSAVRDLSVPIANITTFNALVQDIIDTKPFGCTAYVDGGGTPEIVSKDVGILLSENPPPQKIADAIWELKSDSGRLEILRENSKSNWDGKYNAKRNYQLFSSELKNI